MFRETAQYGSSKPTFHNQATFDPSTKSHLNSCSILTQPKSRTSPSTEICGYSNAWMSLVTSSESLFFHTNTFIWKKKNTFLNYYLKCISLKKLHLNKNEYKTTNQTTHYLIQLTWAYTKTDKCTCATQSIWIQFICRYLKKKDNIITWNTFQSGYSYI